MGRIIPKILLALICNLALSDHQETEQRMALGVCNPEGGEFMI